MDILKRLWIIHQASIFDGPLLRTNVAIKIVTDFSPSLQMLLFAEIVQLFACQDSIDRYVSEIVSDQHSKNFLELISLQGLSRVYLREDVVNSMALFHLYQFLNVNSINVLAVPFLQDFYYSIVFCCFFLGEIQDRGDNGLTFSWDAKIGEQLIDKVGLSVFLGILVYILITHILD